MSAAAVALCAGLGVAIARVNDGSGVDEAGINAPLVLVPAQPVAPPAPAARPTSARVVEPDATPQAPAPPREPEPRLSRAPVPTTERNPAPTTAKSPEANTGQDTQPNAEQNAEQNPEANAERRTPELATEDDQLHRRPAAPDRDRGQEQMQREVGRSMCGQWGLSEERCDSAIRRQQQYR